MYKDLIIIWTLRIMWIYNLHHALYYLHYLARLIDDITDYEML